MTYLSKILIPLRIIVIGCLTLIVNYAIAAVQPLDKVVAVVNKEAITQAELNRQTQLLKDQLVHNKVEVPSDAELRKQVLSNLIDVHLQIQFAKRAGIEVEDAEIDDAMNSVAKQHNITIDQLRQAVAAQGLSLKQYRDNLRKELTMMRVQQQALGKQVQVSDDEVKHLLKANPPPAKTQSTKEYHVENILIPLTETPTAEQVKAAEQKAKELLVKLQKDLDFSTAADKESTSEFVLSKGDLEWRKLNGLPEVFAKDVAKMKVGQIVGPVRASNGLHLLKLTAVRGGGDSNEPKQMVTLNQVRHILLQPIAGETDQDVKARAELLRRKIKAGEKFADLVQQHSKDFVHMKKGGDLGWTGDGKLPPALEAAAQKLKMGEVSAPIKSTAGWHLIQVTKQRQMDVSADYYKQQAKHLLFQRKLSAETNVWIQQLRHHADITVY